MIWISAFLMVDPHAKRNRFHTMSKQGQNLVYFIQPKRSLSLFEFTNEAQANTRSGTNKCLIVIAVTSGTDANGASISTFGGGSLKRLSNIMGSLSRPLTLRRRRGYGGQVVGEHYQYKTL